MIVAGDDAHEFEWQSAVHLASVNHRESEPSIVELRRLERIIYSFPPNAVAWRFGEVAGDEPRVRSVLSAPGPRRSRVPTWWREFVPLHRRRSAYCDGAG